MEVTMRFLVAMMLACCTVSYAQDTNEAPESAEVTKADDGDAAEVSVNVDSFDCGCKDKKPKI